MVNSNSKDSGASFGQNSKPAIEALPPPAVREDIQKILQTPGPVMMKVRKLSIIQARIAASVNEEAHPVYHGLMTDIDRAMSILMGAPSNY